MFADIIAKMIALFDDYCCHCLLFKLFFGYNFCEILFRFVIAIINEYEGWGLELMFCRNHKTGKRL